MALARCWSVGSSWGFRRLGHDLRGSTSLLWRILSGSLLGRAATLLCRLCLNGIVVCIFDFVFLVNGRLGVRLNCLGSSTALLRGRRAVLCGSAALFRLLDGLLLDFTLIFDGSGGLSRPTAFLGRLIVSSLSGPSALLGRWDWNRKLVSIACESMSACDWSYRFRWPGQARRQSRDEGAQRQLWCRTLCRASRRRQQVHRWVSMWRASSRRRPPSSCFLRAAC